MTEVGSRAKKYIGDKDFLTYGDCLSDVDLRKLYTNHKKIKNSNSYWNFTKK